MLTYGLLAILVILVVALLGIVAVIWLLARSSTRTQTTTNVKTQPIVQRFVSNNLKKRAFIIELNQGGYKVIFQRYSEEIVTVAGEVAGWQALPKKPVTDTLSSAVEIAHNWVHADD